MVFVKRGKLSTQLEADVALLVVASVYFLLDPALLLFEGILPLVRYLFFVFPPELRKKKKTLHLEDANLPSSLFSYAEV